MVVYHFLLSCSCRRCWQGLCALRLSSLRWLGGAFQGDRERLAFSRRFFCVLHIGGPSFRWWRDAPGQVLAYVAFVDRGGLKGINRR